MKNTVVDVPSVKEPVKTSPGFEKKGLSTYKLDILGLCGFGCLYCSSNSGNYLRINRKPFATLTKEQTGTRAEPADDPALTYEWPELISELNTQLSGKRPGWGDGHTLVFSMLTDGFSPRMIQQGTTKRALEMLLEHTAFRIRVLTKNAAVGSPYWVDFFAHHADRFVVGLSAGTQDDAWARQIEKGTSPPSARMRSLRNLQDGGVSTYGMLCPVFPDVLQGHGLEALVDEIRPDRVETIWAEPYNDRLNWQVVQAGYAAGTAGHTWFSNVYGSRDLARWSRYATDLYLRLRQKGEREGWIDKLCYLLYERDIQAADAPRFTDMKGVSLQSTRDEHGLSKNPHIRKLQLAK